MKKVLITLLVGILVSSLSYSQTKKNVDVDDFTSVSFGVSGNLTLEQGKNFKVVIEGDEELLEAISVRVTDGRLVIKKPNWRKARNMKLTAYVTMPEIEGVSVSGSGKVINEGSIRCDDVSLSVSGSGNIKFDGFSADEVRMRISGSGGVSIAGTGASFADVSISGSGRVSAADFKVAKAEIGISGSGGCKLWVDDAVKARISGSGSVYIKGDPSIDSRSSGSGKLRKL